MAGYQYSYPPVPPVPPRMPPRPRPAKLLLPALLGAAVAVGLGVYGRLHDPAGVATFDFGFRKMLAMKVWFATGAGLLALLQLFSALWMWRKLPLGEAPEWLGWVHRGSGTLAFLLSLPVAYHCLYSLGYQDNTTRVLVHSLVGCLFYGAFATKLVVLRTKRLPGWALPIVGGLLFTALVAVVLTSAGYTFAETGSPGF